MRTWLSVVISLIVVALIVTQLDLDQLTDVLGQASLGWMGLAMVVFLLNYVLRTIRFRLLFPDQQLPFWPLFSITALYGMLLYLMPAKSGEISFPALLKARLDVDLSESAATLVVARFYDFLSVGLFLPLVLTAFWSRLPPAISYSALAFLGLMGLAAAVYFMWLRRWSPSSAGTTSEANAAWWERARYWLIQVMARLASLSRMPGQGRLLGLTVLIWLAVYTNFYLIASSLGFWMAFGQAVILSLLMVPLTLLPLQGIANLGSHEIGWTAAFSIFGYPTDQALLVTAGSHVLLLLEVLVLGGIGALVGSAPGQTTRSGKDKPDA
jgi:uncharacterized protein (TIRG00374 family)